MASHRIMQNVQANPVTEKQRFLRRGLFFSNLFFSILCLLQNVSVCFATSLSCKQCEPCKEPFLFEKFPSWALKKMQKENMAYFQSWLNFFFVNLHGYFIRQRKRLCACGGGFVRRIETGVHAWLINQFGGYWSRWLLLLIRRCFFFFFWKIVQMDKNTQI